VLGWARVTLGFAFLGIFACQSGAKTLDVVDNSSHLVYRIVSSFLNDTAAWQSIGNPPSQDPYLAYNGGAYVSLRTANKKPEDATSVREIREMYEQQRQPGRSRPGAKT
jgi:hypothetical protein